MRNIPILFNTEMVQAILAGKKTQTRRVAKYSAQRVYDFACVDGKWHESYNPQRPPIHLIEHYLRMGTLGPCMIGDVLWVRETWSWLSAPDCGSFCIGPCKKYKNDYGCFVHKASNPNFTDAWKPSIHMPREAARIFLRVTDVRVELLATISDEDAIAEGANCKGGKNIGVEEKMRRGPVERFAEIWDGTIKPVDFDRFGWAANPYVWVITFECCDKPKGW